MKKLISLTLIAVMALSLLALCSCGKKDVDYSDSKYVGTWKLSELSMLDESDPVGTDWVLEFKADGTGTATSEAETNEFTWEPVDGGLKTKGDVKLKLKDDGDNIVGDLFGVKLIFEKQ